MFPTAIRHALALCAASMVFLAPATAARPAEQVTVFAAASLKTALDEITDAYGSEHGSVRVSYGGSSALARQIQYGAPAGLFISANSDWMDVLQDEGLIDPASRVPLLTNELVLIAGPDVPAGFKIAPGFDLAERLKGGRLAMALVEAVPAGLYGRTALQSLGVWDAVKPKVAQADNVRAALMLVASGEAPYGIVYATDAKADPRVRIVDTFPADSHPPIRYPLARVTGVGDNAQGLFEFLQGDTAATVFTRHGFGLPETGT